MHTELESPPETQRQRLERCLQEVERHPGRAAAHFNLGLAYTVSSRIKEAEWAYSKALEIDPGLIQAWVNLGGIRLMRWDFKGCLEANQMAVSLDPGSVRAHFNQGQAHLYLNQADGLLASTLKVIELDRDHAQAHYFAAVACLALEQLGPAERHLTRALELGHAPNQEFIKAMEKARTARAAATPTLIEITGAQSPDTKPQED